MLPARTDDDDPLAEKFRQFIARPTFPCVGAKAALAKNQIRFVVGRDIASAWDDLRIYPALFNFAKAYRPRKHQFQSFVAIFRGPRTLTEAEFEQRLWQRVQSLTDKDIWHGQRHDKSVSADPASAHFSLSFAGEAFFAIGLHPRASRASRRFCVPAIVFNLHDQFEQLRATGKYNKLHDTIMQRDERFSGSVNPMIQEYGHGSEARQYSGRGVDDDWLCPFHRKDPR